MNQVLEQILATGRCTDLAGKERAVTGGVPREDAVVLQEMVRLVRAGTALETGVAFGVSTLAICEALAEVGQAGARLYGIDPDQHKEHGGAAIQNLRQAGLEGLFQLCEGPSHFELPRLLSGGLRLDFAFIDGWHTFDYTLVDFFYIDKMLRPGGILCIHDSLWPSKAKVLGYVVTHRKYRCLPVARRGGERGLKGMLRFPYRVLRGTPVNQARALAAGEPNIAVLEKLEDFEPEHRYFADF